VKTRKNWGKTEARSFFKEAMIITGYFFGEAIFYYGIRVKKAFFLVHEPNPKSLDL